LRAIEVIKKGLTSRLCFAHHAMAVSNTAAKLSC
jgi:hypothetical protein